MPDRGLLPAVKRGLVATMLAFVGVACSTPTGPDGLPGVSFQVAYAASPQAPAGATSPPTVLSDGQGLVVLGLMTTAPCDNFYATASKSGTQVTITVAARPSGQCFLDSVATFAYRATTPLERGSYSVEVVHDHAGTLTVVRTATVVVQ